MLLALQKNIVYGPVNSRRLGRSLGINILPQGKKICTFNCRYCQYGWTDYELVRSTGEEEFPRTDEIISAVEYALRNLDEPPVYLTFSGNGEATIHPRFPEIVDALIRLRDNAAPRAKTAILSNSAGVNNKLIRNALQKLDARIMKLDAGTQPVFSLFNDPIEGIDIEAVTEGLAAMKEIIIQSLFAGGPEGNTEANQIKNWVSRVKYINPSLVQIYTLDRGTPSSSLIKLEKEDLTAVKSMLDREGINSEVYCRNL